MRKDKKLYIVGSLGLLLTIAVLVQAWGVSIRTVIVFGFGGFGWSILALWKARIFSGRRETPSTQATLKRKTIRRRWMLIERIVFSLIFAFSGVSLVRGLVTDKPLYAILEAAFVILMSSSHFLLLWLSDD
jgi:hypothetical protein